MDNMDEICDWDRTCKTKGCHFVKSKCVPFRQPNESCEYDRECQNDACGRVGRPGPDGYRYECCESGQTQWRWFSDYCVQPGNSPCEHDVQCKSGTCNENNKCA